MVLLSDVSDVYKLKKKKQKNGDTSYYGFANIKKCVLWVQVKYINSKLEIQNKLKILYLFDDNWNGYRGEDMIIVIIQYDIQLIFGVHEKFYFCFNIADEMLENWLYKYDFYINISYEYLFMLHKAITYVIAYEIEKPFTAVVP